MPELRLILKSMNDRLYEDRKFFAGIQGIDLDEPTNKSKQESFDSIQRRALARAGGASDVESAEESIHVREFGFGSVDD